jgi:ATP-dependent protease ClpP protease subunit
VLKFILAAAAAILSCAPTPAHADTETSINQTIDGVVDGSVVDLADKLMAASAPGTLRRVNLLLNSPGGGVLEGSVYISAMEVAKTRGAEINCYVPLVAASMAFSILAHCDNRYALEGALFLWHPPRVVTGNYPLTPKDAAVLALDLAAVSKRMVKDLRKYLPIKTSTFYYHFNAETLHTAPELIALSPGWITIVKDIKGTAGLSPGRSFSDAWTGASNSPYVPWRITYIWAEYFQ